jgi:uncharacterized membrane protein YozB (DUF420 family)
VATLVVLALLGTALLGPAQPVAAHPPEGLTVVLDEWLSVLTISIRHNVKDRSTHYIESVEVWVNGAEAAEKTYTSQPSGSFTVRLKLDVAEGDRVLVRATCNLNGTKEQELVVGKGITEAGTNAGRVHMVILAHASIQTLALVLALAIMPGGYAFLRAWRTQTAPKGRRRLHARLGSAVAALWGLGALGGIYIVYLTSGDFLGSPHGWLAIATFGAALIAGYSASPAFRSAGYGARITTHMALGLMAVGVAVAAMVLGLRGSGLI